MAIGCLICDEHLDTPAPISSSGIENGPCPKPKKPRAGSKPPATPTTVCCTPCGHAFHELCLHQWFKNKSSATCPVCRKVCTKGRLIRIFPSQVEGESDSTARRSSASDDVSVSQTSTPSSHPSTTVSITRSVTAPSASVPTSFSSVSSGPVLASHSNSNIAQIRPVFTGLPISSPYATLTAQRALDMFHNTSSRDTTSLNSNNGSQISGLQSDGTIGPGPDYNKKLFPAVRPDFKGFMPHSTNSTQSISYDRSFGPVNPFTNITPCNVGVGHSQLSTLPSHSRTTTYIKPENPFSHSNTSTSCYSSMLGFKYGPSSSIETGQSTTLSDLHGSGSSTSHSSQVPRQTPFKTNLEASCSNNSSMLPSTGASRSGGSVVPVPTPTTSYLSHLPAENEVEPIEIANIIPLPNGHPRRYQANNSRSGTGTQYEELNVLHQTLITDYNELQQKFNDSKDENQLLKVQLESARDEIKRLQESGASSSRKRSYDGSLLSGPPSSSLGISGPSNSNGNRSHSIGFNSGSIGHLLSHVTTPTSTPFLGFAHLFEPPITTSTSQPN